MVAGWSAVRDPDEGVTTDGMIRTGVCRNRVPADLEPVLAAAVEAVATAADDLELHLYGSVATGMAHVPDSDVDLMSIGLAADRAALLGRLLSERFGSLCRGVEIGVAQPPDFLGEDDRAYGNQAFLRHYCVSLLGVDAFRIRAPFKADARAARGFNGDIGRHLDRWRSEMGTAVPAELGRRVARKTLFAVTGLVSVHERTWTTDRAGSARHWAERHPTLSDGLARLSAWAEAESAAGPDELATALTTGGIVSTIVQQFTDQIGLWSEGWRRRA